jgi:hypothetical protein
VGLPILKIPVDSFSRDFFMRPFPGVP